MIIMAIIIPDSPEIDNQRLKFDFIFYADAIADLISGCSKEPLSICINGPWGTGKTSLLYAIQRKLNEQKDRYTTVNFNAWKYSKSESLYASLLQRIFLAVANDNILEQLKQRYSNPFKKRYDLLRATVSTIGDVIGAKVDPEEYLKPSSFRDNLPFFDEFESVMNNVLQEQLKVEKKMVIFIDDLDRCTPTQTIEVLEAVKTFLDLENCVFVLAMDKSHAEASIKSHYGDIPIDKFEKKYLDKLIHITFGSVILNRE